MVKISANSYVDWADPYLMRMATAFLQYMDSKGIKTLRVDAFAIHRILRVGQSTSYYMLKVWKDYGLPRDLTLDQAKDLVAQLKQQNANVRVTYRKPLQPRILLPLFGFCPHKFHGNAYILPRN